MPPHPYSVACDCPACLTALGTTLEQLRDALMLLSLALQDLQFVCDEEQRARSKRAMQDLLGRYSV